MIAVAIPGLRLASTLNARQHWRARAAAAKRQRATARLCLSAHPRPTGPIVVTLTRVARRFAGGGGGGRPTDSDNLAGACKSVSDGVADWLGVDDGAAERAGLVAWQCAQETQAKFYAVRITIEASK